MKVPRSTVVEFVETVCGFENEFRSRFNRLEDAVVNLKTRVSRLKKVAAKTGSSSCLNNTIQQTGSAASTSTDALGDGQNTSNGLNEDDFKVLDQIRVLFEKDEDASSANDTDNDGPTESTPSAPDLDEVLWLKNRIMSAFPMDPYIHDSRYIRPTSEGYGKRPAIPLTMDERIEIVLLARSHNHRDIADAFNKKHPDRRPVTRSCISRLLSKLKETGSIADKSRSGRPRKTDDAASLIVDRFRRNPEMSLRQLAAETGFSRSRIHRIIRTYKRSDDSADKTNLESS